MPQRANRPSDADLIKAWESAAPEETFAAFGARYSIGGERVRQIVAAWEQEHGVKLPRHRDERKAAIKAAKAASREAAARLRHTAPNIVQRLLRHAVHIEETGCWAWRGRLHTVGRTVSPFFSGLGERYAHRLAYRLWRGDIPKGHKVVWTCEQPVCINPYHLKTLTQSEVVRRSPEWDSDRNTWRHNKPRAPATHCAKGHEFTPENTAWNTASEKMPDGTRVKVRTRLCKTCLTERQKSYPPKPKPPPPPPLPADFEERDLERPIRRLFRVSPRKRLAALENLLAEFPESNHEPAQEGELYYDYFQRIWRSGKGAWPSYEAWFRSRVLADPRVRELLAGEAKSTG